MKTNTRSRRVPTRFGEDTRFSLAPKFEPIGPDQTQGKFEQLKARLLKPVLQDTPNPALRHQLRLAANEAAAVAWTTPFPLLVLPNLLEEKTAEVYQHALHQEQVRQASLALAEANA